jgi:phosphotransferase system HPr (HPr) family protein
VIEAQAPIVNRLGLHARAAAKLVHLASGFESDVHLISGGEEVDAKSILGVLLLAVAQGMTVVIRCDGRDEQEALRAVTDLIASRFGEES